MGKERRELLVIGVTRELNKLIDQARVEYTAICPGINPSNICYEWIFKEYCPRFPSTYDACNPLPRNIQSWTEWQLGLCTTALSRQYLYCMASALGSHMPDMSGLDVQVDLASEGAGRKCGLNSHSGCTAEPSDINGPNHLNHYDRTETVSCGTSVDNTAHLAGSIAGRQLDLRRVGVSLKALETQLASLADAEYQRGRADQKRAAEDDTAIFQQALIQAQEERDSAVAELNALRRDTEQLREAAKALAVLNIFADNKPNYLMPGSDAKEIKLPEPTKTHSPPFHKQLKDDASTITIEQQRKSERPSVRPGQDRGLFEILAEFAAPVIIHSKKHLFPELFVETVLSKPDNSISAKSNDKRSEVAPCQTFALKAHDKRLKIVPWKTIIRIHPEIHEFAPDFRRHGALTFIKGDPNLDFDWPAERARPDRTTEIDSVPVFRYAKISNTATTGYYYIGHCKLGSRIDISASTWNRWNETHKRALTKNFLRSEWGPKLLSSKGIQITTAAYHFSEKITEEVVDELLPYFYKEDGPKLELVHVVLEKKKYSEKQSKDLALEFNFCEDDKEKKEKRQASDESEDWPGGKRQKTVVRDPWDDDFDSDYDATPP